MVDYKLTRTSRVSIGMYIRDGFIEVRAPFFYSVSDIDKFVRSREKWAANRLAESKERVAKRKSFCLTYGSQVTYRGELYTIAEKENGKSGFIDTFFFVPPNMTPEEIKRHCINAYQLHAETILYNRALKFIERMVVLPSDLKINNAKARWGSCSAKKSVNIAWRLIMADDSAIDYVIVHELAHLIEYNHSAGFWAVVESYIPDYKEQQAKLKTLEYKLSFENWDR